MPVCVYALVARPVMPLGKGAFREPLRAIRGNGVCAIVGRTALSRKPTESALRSYDRVVRRLFATHDPLAPARFGTSFDDDAEITQMLADRRAALAGSLARVAGGEQITLRIFSEAPLAKTRPSPEGGPGTRFLAKRQAASAPPKALAPLLLRLKPFVLETRVESHDAAPLRASVHQLIRRDRSTDYLRALDEAALPAGITIRATGPNPPWAFAETA